MTHFLEAPPGNVESQIQRNRTIGSRMMAAGHYRDAFELSRQMYEMMLQKQPAGRRWHKGEPLHNMGYVRIRSGLLEQGLRFTLEAFIEDSLSCGDRNPSVFDELEMPAAQTLKLSGYSEDELHSMAKQARARLARGVLVEDPKKIYAKDNYEQRIGAAVARLESSPAALRAIVGPLGPPHNTHNPIVALWDMLGRMAAIRGRLEVVLVVGGSLSGVAMTVAGFLAGALGLAGAAFVGIGVVLIVVSAALLYQWTR